MYLIKYYLVIRSVNDFMIGVIRIESGKLIGRVARKADSHLVKKLLTKPRLIKVITRDMMKFMLSESIAPINTPWYLLGIFGIGDLAHEPGDIGYSPQLGDRTIFDAHDIDDAHSDFAVGGRYSIEDPSVNTTPSNAIYNFAIFFNLILQIVPEPRKGA